MKNRPHEIAIVGTDCIFPGASDIGVFEKNLLEKKPAIIEVPADRWVLPKEKVLSPGSMPDTAVSGRAGVITDFSFDPDGFMLPAGLLEQLDTTHKLVLKAGRKALVNLSVNKDLRERTGVILAAISLPTESASETAWQIMHREKAAITSAEAAAAEVVSLPAAIIARAFGFKGGTFTLDAACASSLYAVKLACDELSCNRADMMITGGVSRTDLLYTQIGFTQLKALSPSGRCAPFDRKADGLVVGEGTGIMVLKRLQDALAAKNPIYGVISGCGMSNDIEGSLVSPASEGQVRAMKQAYRLSRWSPADVQHVECHGSGTPVGDTIELNSMAAVWHDMADTPYKCAIGSVKSMTGHLLTAAGAAGMIKTLVAMNGKFLPPSLNFSAPAENSPLEQTGFTVQTDVSDWETPTGSDVRKAAVSGFGFGGINAHMLVREHNTDSTKLFTPPRRPAAVTQEAPGFKPVGRQVAVVGMGILTGTCNGLTDFFSRVFSGEPISGGINSFSKWADLTPGEFHIPPNQMDDILPNQLLMLKASKEALKDAGFAHRPAKDEKPRTDFGAAVGIAFDFKATDYYRRWKTAGLGKDDPDAVAPPLTASRTLGALGGIVASRVAREFKLGGPCFTVSAGAASGIKAFQAGVNAVSSGEAGHFLCGCVDMACDPRQLSLDETVRPFSPTWTARPFDRAADGAVPSEGAAAVVLKPLDRAVADNDRIYCVIRGTGSASAGPMAWEDAGNTDEMTDVCKASLEKTLHDASVDFHRIGLYAAHGSGNPQADTVEAAALDAAAGDNPDKAPGENTASINADIPFRTAVSSASGTVGDTKGVSALVSFIQAALACYTGILPPLAGFRIPAFHNFISGRFHIPVYPGYWIKETPASKRTALIGSMTADGSAAHAVIEACPDTTCRETDRFTLPFQKRGIFILRGKSEPALICEIHRLRQFAGTGSVYVAAKKWYDDTSDQPRMPHTLSIVADSTADLLSWLDRAERAVRQGESTDIKEDQGVAYTLTPMAGQGKLAFLYPGSGNHFLQMGRELGLMFPDILQEMAEKGHSLKQMFLPHLYYPWRLSWDKDWQENARQNIRENPHHMIFGQIAYGILMTAVASRFNIAPHAAMGHSLGESAMLLSLGVWPDAGAMRRRMENTDLFTHKLSGDLSLARKVWQMGPKEPVRWVAAAVNRSEEAIRKRINSYERVYLLIVNSPEETVIGGEETAVRRFIKDTGCGAMFLEGVVSVHCPVAQEAAPAYRDLHRFECRPDPNIDFYSCFLGERYVPEEERTAELILQQALHGFDYSALIQNAWRDNVRIFLEIGPGASCSRLVGKTLASEEHLSVSLSSGEASEGTAFLKGLAKLAANGVDVDLGPYFKVTPSRREKTTATPGVNAGPVTGAADPTSINAENFASAAAAGTPDAIAIENLSETLSCAGLHEKFLALTRDNMAACEVQFQALTRIAGRLTDNMAAEHAILSEHNRPAAAAEGSAATDDTAVASAPAGKKNSRQEPLFDRDMCMAFATGKAATVLGERFHIVDSYPVRVRLPDEPLMLVDRIMAIEGEMCSLSSGKIITQHDVKADAWYLDGGRAPVSISIEAGQADLFLCSYLGIDHAVQGKRRYRLLDAKVTFHRPLPVPGETIEFHIEIDRFLKQQDVYLFFFHYRGYIDGAPFISMRDGCAGFFTPEEIQNSQGIVLKQNEKRKSFGGRPWLPPARARNAAFDDQQVNALRSGNLSQAFGKKFDGCTLGRGLRLPGGRMHLIDRVTLFEPEGGRFRLGAITAQADIRPDHWFLTCHFTDDRVMPGTLMYECCAHALRIFTLRMGWISERDDIHWDIVEGFESDLKCRGPVTCDTRKAGYYVEVKEMGYAPEPYVKADARMFADDLQIVLYRDMGMKMAGLSRNDIEAIWRR